MSFLNLKNSEVPGAPGSRENLEFRYREIEQMASGSPSDRLRNEALISIAASLETIAAWCQDHPRREG